MPIVFSLTDADTIGVIVLTGAIGVKDITEMRAETMRFVRDSNILNWIVDLSAVTSMVEASKLRLFLLGEDFRTVGFSLSSRTAIIEPIDQVARENARFLHMVEVNRGRGPIAYFDSHEEARSWLLLDQS